LKTSVNESDTYRMSELGDIRVGVVGPEGREQEGELQLRDSLTTLGNRLCVNQRLGDDIVNPFGTNVFTA
jgi:hypothetical protein